MKKKSFKELLNEAKEWDTYWTACIVLNFTEDFIEQWKPMGYLGGTSLDVSELVPLTLPKS
jgi:hypothetical protein